MVLHKFLALAKATWKEDYLAGHRLANYEQCLALMSQVLNLPMNGEAVTDTEVKVEDNTKWIRKGLAENTEKSIVDSDWTFSGLKIYCEQVGPEEFMLNKMSNWFGQSQDYYDHPILSNPRSLFKYLIANRSMLVKTMGLVDLTPDAIGPEKKKYVVRPEEKS